MIWPWCERYHIAYPEFANIGERYPKFGAWVAAMKDVPGVKATIFSQELHEGFYKGYLEKSANAYDYGLE